MENVDVAKWFSDMSEIMACYSSWWGKELEESKTVHMVINDIKLE